MAEENTQEVKPMGGEVPTRYTKVRPIAEIAVNEKETEALLNELFIGNHIAYERHVQRLTKLVKIVDTW